MDIVTVLILSSVEGITEFLPVSSTGHLILTSELLRIPSSDFLKSFEVIIQLGAILAVITLYAKRLLSSRELWYKIFAAFIPTAILGLIFYEVIKTYLLSNVLVTLVMLFLGGIALIVWERFYTEQPHHKEKIESLSYKQALLVGVFQSISMVPGVSRSAATIIGGLTVGLKRKPAVELSFLLAIPTMAAATGLDLVKSNFAFSSSEWGMIALGFAGAFITALLAVKYFVRYVEHHSFVAFGIYRIILALLFWIFIVR